MRVPIGPRLHRGLDGLILGLMLVYVAKLPVSALLGRGFPLVSTVNRYQDGVAAALGGVAQAAASAGSGGAGGAGVVDALVLLVLGIAALPLRVFGAPDFGFDLVLVWVGGWLAILGPAWYWVVLPLRDRGLPVGPGRLLAGLLKRLL